MCHKLRFQSDHSRDFTVFPTVQRIVSWDGGWHHSAGRFWICTYRSGTSALLLFTAGGKNNNNLIVGKMQNYFIKLSLWATPVCVCVSHLSFDRRKKFPESWGRGWRRCSSLKKRQKRRRGFTRTRRRWRGIALFYSQFKWSKPFVYVFVQKWSEALLLSSCIWTAGNHCG